jgi:predicted transposase YbfD/YdcC
LPKKTVKAIVDSGNEYVIQVKVNQKSLFDGVQKIIKGGKWIDRDIRKEVNKGREEKRTVRLFLNDGKHISPEWKKVNRIIEITNEGKREGHRYLEKHYYISSVNYNRAEFFGTGIRSHWCIENKLHRVKDVIQNEDGSLIREKRIASNLSLMKSIAISLFHAKGYPSIKYALERYRNRVDDCLELIGIRTILKNKK